MKFLKSFLIAIYVILILLLVLSLKQCSGNNNNINNKTPIKEAFKADIILCIDCTGSMDNIINTIKNNAVTFYPDLNKKCISLGKEITSIRIKVIAFKDNSESPAYKQSDFFNIPEQNEQFKLFIAGLTAQGGGDAPEIGYDAISLAMASQWLKDENTHQVIILWTDDASHSITQTIPGPKNFEEMSVFWKTKMDQNGKRLILFAPNDSSWTNIENNWDKTFRHDVSLGAGLSELDYEKIIKALSESI